MTSKESLKIFIFFLLKVVLTENQNAVFKSSHWRCSVKKGVLTNFAKFTGKHLCQSLFFNKVAGLRPVEKETLAHVFPVNFKKFLRTTFLQNTFKWLLLNFKETWCWSKLFALNNWICVKFFALLRHGDFFTSLKSNKIYL